MEHAWALERRGWNSIMVAKFLKALATDLSEKRRDIQVSGLRWLSEWPNAAARAAIVAVAIFMAWLTWAHWGDIQIDCGRELYVPIEILRGKLLYRDLWYRYGPLPPYLQAALIAVFGKNLNVFYLFGLTMTIGCALLLFEIGAILEGSSVGLAAAMAFLFQGFSPWLFNYIFPYTYAATMGLSLSLLCVLFGERYLLGLAGYDLMVSALAAGLALLCKLEFGTACYLMLGFVLVVQASIERSARALLNGLGVCAPGIFLCVAVYGWVFWKFSPRLMLDNWAGPSQGYHFLLPSDRYFYAHIGFRFIPTEIVSMSMIAIAVVLFWYLMARLGRHSASGSF